MTDPPRIRRATAAETFASYAKRYKEEAGAIASLLSSTRDPIMRKRYENKLQRAREQVSFYEQKAAELREGDK